MRWLARPRLITYLLIGHNSSAMIGELLSIPPFCAIAVDFPELAKLTTASAIARLSSLVVCHTDSCRQRCTLSPSSSCETGKDQHNEQNRTGGKEQRRIEWFWNQDQTGTGIEGENDANDCQDYPHNDHAGQNAFAPLKGANQQQRPRHENDI